MFVLVFSFGCFFFLFWFLSFFDFGFWCCAHPSLSAIFLISDFWFLILDFWFLIFLILIFDFSWFSISDFLIFDFWFFVFARVKWPGLWESLGIHLACLWLGSRISSLKLQLSVAERCSSSLAMVPFFLLFFKSLVFCL